MGIAATSCSCAAYLDDDKSSPAGDDRMSVFVDLRNERDLGFEIDIEKKGRFPFGKALLWYEEASLKRLHAGAPDRREHVGPVIGMKRTDFNRTAPGLLVVRSRPPIHSDTPLEHGRSMLW